MRKMKKKNKLLDKNYTQFFEELKQRIRSSQQQAYRAVNKELIRLYFDIGGRIVERQEQLGWGKQVVEQLAEDLKNDLPGIRGFSASQLWFMRQFYLNYRGNEDLLQLVREIPWGQNIAIFTKVKDPLQREFYLRMCFRNGWSRNILIHQLESKAFERFMVNSKDHNFEETLPAKQEEIAKAVVKDSYVLDFLDIGEGFQERELETALLDRIKDFLLALGNGFAFIGNQYKLAVGNSEYFIDLLLYQRHLKCLFAIELKIGSFQPEYAGKMNFYLNALDDLERLPDENPPIGLILCKDKDSLVVEYALKDIQKPIGVSKYYTTIQLPKNLEKELPTVGEIKSKLLKMFSEDSLKKTIT